MPVHTIVGSPARSRYSALCTYSGSHHRHVLQTHLQSGDQSQDLCQVCHQRRHGARQRPRPARVHHHAYIIETPLHHTIETHHRHCRICNRSTSETVHWSLEPMHTSKNDPPPPPQGRNDTAGTAIIRSMDLGFPLEIAEGGGRFTMLMPSRRKRRTRRRHHQVHPLTEVWVFTRILLHKFPSKLLYLRLTAFRDHNIAG